MKPTPRERLATTGLVLALVCVFAAPARAQRNETMQACRADFTKLCKGVKLGGGRAADCLKQHEAELMPECRTAVAKLGDCGQEIKKICGTDSGAGAVRECMKTHASEFSSTCQTSLKAR